MLVVNIHDAKSQLSALINKVLQGEKIIIAKNNTPIVEIIPIPKKTRVSNLLRGKIKYEGILDTSDSDILKDFELNEVFPK